MSVSIESKPDLGGNDAQGGNRYAREANSGKSREINERQQGLAIQTESRPNLNRIMERYA